MTFSILDDSCFLLLEDFTRSMADPFSLVLIKEGAATMSLLWCLELVDVMSSD